MCFSASNTQRMMHAIRRGQGLLRTLAACGTLLAPCTAGADDGTPRAVEADAGFDAAPRSLYWYKAAIVALNRDISKDGFLFRMYGSLAAYAYGNPDVAGGEVDGDLWQFDLMPGYQTVRGGVTLGGFLGFDFQDSQLEPEDPTNAVSGTRTGLKVEGHFYFEDERQPIQASLVGEYSTAFDTYFAQLRLGARVFDQLFVGPEGSVDGDTGYNAQRIGAYARYAFELTKEMPLELTFAGGHQFVDGWDSVGEEATSGVGGGAGTYGTIEIDTNF
jgi:hypothetical protein